MSRLRRLSPQLMFLTAGWIAGAASVHVVVVGPKQSGKTSLVLDLVDALSGLEYDSCRVRLGELLHRIELGRWDGETQQILWRPALSAQDNLARSEVVDCESPLLRYGPLHFEETLWVYELREEDAAGHNLLLRIARELEAQGEQLAAVILTVHAELTRTNDDCVRLLELARRWRQHHGGGEVVAACVGGRWEDFPSRAFIECLRAMGFDFGDLAPEWRATGTDVSRRVRGIHPLLLHVSSVFSDLAHQMEVGGNQERVGRHEVVDRYRQRAAFRVRVAEMLRLWKTILGWQKEAATDVCLICLEPNGRDCRRLLRCGGCQVAAHRHCLGSWLQLNGSCPACRADFVTGERS